MWWGGLPGVVCPWQAWLRTGFGLSQIDTCPRAALSTGPPGRRGAEQSPTEKTPRGRERQLAGATSASQERGPARWVGPLRRVPPGQLCVELREVGVGGARFTPCSHRRRGAVSAHGDADTADPREGVPQVPLRERPVPGPAWTPGAACGLGPGCMEVPGHLPVRVAEGCRSAF